MMLISWADGRWCLTRLQGVGIQHVRLGWRHAWGVGSHMRLRNVDRVLSSASMAHRTGGLDRLVQCEQ